MLYSIGKDSAVLLHSPARRSAPASSPFPLLHVDTHVEVPGDDHIPRATAARSGSTCRSTPIRTASGRTSIRSTTTASLHPDHENRCAEAGADRRQIRRRHRRCAARRGTIPRQGARVLRPWTRPYLGPEAPAPGTLVLSNGQLAPGESLRVFPLSNWTEMDVWTYIAAEDIPSCRCISPRCAPPCSATAP